MDKEIKQEFETRDKVLDGIREEIDSLTGSLGVFKEETTGQIAELREGQSSLQDSKDTSESASLEEQAVKVAQLEERNVFLEGKDYQNQVIRGFLRELDADNFLAIGVKLGYLEDTEAGPEEVALGDNRTLKVSKEKPEDMTGWEYSETQGLYIKLE